MKKYSIDFEAKIFKNIEIEAENEEQAREIAQDMLDDREVCFESGEQNHDDFEEICIKDVWEKQKDGSSKN